MVAVRGIPAGLAGGFGRGRRSRRAYRSLQGGSVICNAFYARWRDRQRELGSCDRMRHLNALLFNILAGVNARLKLAAWHICTEKKLLHSLIAQAFQFFADGPAVTDLYIGRLRSQTSLGLVMSPLKPLGD